MNKLKKHLSMIFLVTFIVACQTNSENQTSKKMENKLNDLETVDSYLMLLKDVAKNGEKAWAILADDFKNVDQDGNVVLDKERFVGVSRNLLASFPDLTFVKTDIKEEDGFVIVHGHNEGTFMNDIDLSAMNVGVVEATGKRVVWPEASFKISVNNGKIVTWAPYKSYGGAAAWLSALGVELPEK